VARPMLRPDPVTSATFPSSLPITPPPAHGVRQLEGKPHPMATPKNAWRRGISAKASTGEETN
jgi:hypothetical protein